MISGQRRTPGLTSKRVFHHQHNRVDRVRSRRHNLLGQDPVRFGISRNESRLTHIRRELVLGHLHHLTLELMQDPLPVCQCPMLQHKLNHIVLNERSVNVVVAERPYSPRTDLA